MSSLNSDFTLQLNTSVDTSKIQKTLNQNKYIIKADFDLSNLTSKFDKVLSTVIKKSNLGERINREIEKNVTGINKQGKVVQNLTKYTETFKNSMGDVTERISLFTEKGKLFGQTYNTIKVAVDKVTKSISESRQVINGYETSIKDVKTVIQDTAGGTKELIERTSQWTDASNNVHTLTEHFEVLNGVEQRVGASTETVTQAVRKLGNETKKTQTIFEKISKVTSFYIASIPVRVMQQALGEVTNSIREFDIAITEMEKVSSLSGKQLRDYSDDLAELGSTVSRTKKEMVEGATSWLKAGYNEEDAKKLTQYSALLQNTFDETTLSSAESTEILVSVLKGFNFTADETIRVLDVINKVSATEAVTSSDLTDALKISSAALSTYNNTFEETISLITAGSSVMQGRSQQVARGLQTVANRITKNEELLRKYGVSIYDSNNQLKSTFEILKELKPKWDEISDSERISLGNALAG